MSKVILKGVVGSHAYNLATENSDVDRMQIWIEPLTETLGLPHKNKSKHYESDTDDLVSHEVGKFCQLALDANPNVLEFLFLPEYELVTDEGRILLDRKYSFLSEKVRKTFCGYAYGQFKKLKNRGGDSFSSDTRLRTQKHSKHMFRLLKQGYDALTTGDLQVSLPDEQADAIKLWSQLSTVDMIDEFERQYEIMHNVESCLPEEPNHDYINDTLATIRLMQGVGNP